MKKKYLLFATIILFKLSIAQTSYVWNGATSTNWNTNTNWTPNGIPGVIDNVTIVTGANNCILAANTTVTNLTITSGLLNINAFTLNTTGVVACNSGSCTNGTFNSTATSLTFAGTTFGANIIANVTDVYLNGSIFNGSVAITKNSASNIQSTGNNVFNGTTSITNSGTGYLLLTNGTVGRNETFNGTTTLNTTNTGALYIGYSRNVAVNANVTINNTAGTGLIQIGRIGTVTLNTGITMSCGTFAGASLNLYNIVQTGSASQTLAPGNASAVNIYGSNITGSLTVNAGIITAQTSTFAAAVSYSVGGTILNNWSAGGNTYNGVLTVTNSSNGYIGFANGTADTYNSDVYATNTSSTGGRIIFGNNCTSQFNGNVYVSQSGTNAASGIALGWGGTFPVINLAAGKNILVNGAFSSGYLQLLKMQTGAGTAINLTTSGTANVILQNNVFAGSVTVNSPDIYPYGGTYNGPVIFTKTGGGSGNHNSGNQNIFNSTLEINNQNGGGYFLLSYQSSDQFNDNVTVTSTGTAAGISLGWNGGTCTPVLAAGKTISIGPAGYSSGYLQLGSFTQLGNAPINLTLTGTASFQLVKPNIVNTIGGALSVTAPDIYVQGATFNGAAVFTKTGGGSNHNNGNQNIFNSTCTINQQSTGGYFMLGYNSNDLFNDDITVTSTGTGGIYLGWQNGTGTPTLASGKTITIGGAGFNNGFLYFGAFTQLGAAAINLSLTGTTTNLTFRGSTFGGNIISSSPSILFNGSTFNGSVSSTKIGTNSDASSGGNTFNSTSEFINNGSGYLLFGNGNPDIWNGDVTFTNTGAERILPCWNSAGNIFNGNITLNSTGSSVGINFCGGSVAATATMSATKTINTGTFNRGYLILQRFTQLGSAPVNLTLATGSSYLQYGPTSTLGGNVTSTSPTLYLHGCTFNGTTDITKTGATGDYSNGGNIFNGISTITNNGTSFLLLGNTSPDIWNNDVTFTNNSNERILPAWATVGNQFNGNIYVNTTGSAQGIQFCGGNATATATLAATKSIFSGGIGLNAGYLILKQFTQLGNAPINLTLSSTATYLQYGPLSSLGGNVTSVSPSLYFNGCTFSGTANCTKNGATNDASIGNNFFNGSTVMTNSGSGYLLFGNGNADQFNSTATFNNTGSNNIYVAYNSTNNIFGGVTTFNNAPTSNTLIYVSPYSAGTIFNDNIIVTSTNGQGVQFCTSNATASATLAASKTISIGGAGFSTGTLLLKQFTQVGNTAQSLTLTGNGILTYGPTCAFGGDVTSTSPTLYFNGCNFSRAATCTKNGATNDASIGNNFFNGSTVMTNSGSGYLLFGNGNADQFNSTATFNNTGSNNIYVAYNSSNNIFGGVTTFNNAPTANTLIYVSPYSAGTIFNDNIIVTSTNGQGVQFCTSNATASATLAASKTISIGGAGFSAGTLLLKQFTQVGNTAQSLTLTGNGILTYGPLSSFGGDVTSSSPSLFFNGCNFNRTLTSVKTGTPNDASTGGNIFNGVTTITDNGAGYLLLGNTTRDQFNANTTFNNNGDYRFYFAHNHNAQTTTFASDLTLNSNKSVSDGWSYFACEGNNTSFTVGGNFTINNSNTIQSNIRFLQGTGTTATYSGNVIINLTNSNASTQIQMGTVGTSVYNGNITVSNTLGGISSGVFFNTSASASSTLAATKTISIGGSGFNGGTLSLIRFTQLGSTLQTLSQLTGTATLISGPTNIFNGDVNFNFPQVYLNGATYNGITTIQKNGVTDNDCIGGNIFNNITTITNSSVNRLRLANTTLDNYNSDVTMVQSNTGVLAPNYNTNCTYSGNVSVSSPSTYTISFGSAASGIATFNGGATQTINKIGTVGNPVFTRLIVNKSANSITLNTRINVSSALTLTQGIINTTQTNILNMNDLSTTTVGNSLSYINGPMNYDMALNGARTLNFPIGKTTDWRPAILNAIHNNVTSYTYNSEVFNANARALNWTLPATVTNVSLVHYWDIARSNTATGVITPTLNLAGNQTITLYYDVNDGVTDPTNLTVCKNTYTATTTWKDIGGSGATMTTGNVTSTSAPTGFNSFSRFTLGNRIGGSNPLPIELLYFTASKIDKSVSLNWATSSETNNDYFEIERSVDAINFEFVAKVNSHNNGNNTSKQFYETIDNKPYQGLSYYRLKQVDKSGSFKYADIVSVEYREKSSIGFYPNPTKDKLFIKATEDYNQSTLSIFNITGSEVKTSGLLLSFNGVIDLSDLVNGMYFIIVTNGSQIENAKIIVER